MAEAAPKTYTVEYHGEGFYHFHFGSKKYSFSGKTIGAETYDDAMASIVPMSGIPEEVAAVLAEKTLTESTREPMFRVYEDDAPANVTPSGIKLAPKPVKPNKPVAKTASKDDGFGEGL